jgi:hypothetical protein
MSNGPKKNLDNFDFQLFLALNSFVQEYLNVLGVIGDTGVVAIVKRVAFKTVQTEKEVFCAIYAYYDQGTVTSLNAGDIRVLPSPSYPYDGREFSMRYRSSQEVLRIKPTPLPCEERTLPSTQYSFFFGKKGSN